MSETLRILMVEDQEADAILIQRELRRRGLAFTARRVACDDAMIQALREFAPDLVLSDVALPGFSGLEALAILRQERPGVPLIFVSGTVGEEQAVELLNLGATDYVLKENLTRLTAAVDRAMREAQFERERRQLEARVRKIAEKPPTRGLGAPPPVGAGSPSGIAHDLNNTLAPIPMAVSMLRSGPADPEREKLYAIIEHCARRASEIVRVALLASEGGGERRRPLEIEPVIKEVFQKLQKTWPENLKVKLAVGEDLWQTTGDAAQIEQVIRDLCVHAGKAMPGGGTLRLQVSNHQVDAAGSPPALPGLKPGPYLLLEISDTGPGGPPVAAARGGGEEVGGSLSTVLGIVKKQGGLIQVASVPGEGTTCRVFLPASRGEVVPAKAATVRRARPGECILLVDDEETIRFAAKAVLSKHGYRVLTATDGADALKVFHVHADEIALVLTDLMMPVMGGMALVQAVRQFRPGLPFIVSSGQNEKTRLAELQAAGIDTVLNKPYAADVLLRTVTEVLDRRAGPVSESG